MIRHFYISDNLDDLDSLEVELENSGVHKPQIHVLSNNDTGVETHEHLHNIQSVFKQDVVHGTIIGAIVGLVAAMVVLVIANVTSVYESYTWIPFIFLAVVILGFCTWWGGFVGIQTPHKDFARFIDILNAGKHVFIVDVEPEQEQILQRIVNFHPGIQDAGTGEATPRWVVVGQQTFTDITSRTFP